MEGNPRLGQQANVVLHDGLSQLVLPIIVLSEATLLIERGRIGIPTVSGLLSDVSSDRRIEIHPLTMEVFEHALSSDGLRIPELHDRFIVSTGLYLQSLGHTVKILTRDDAITNANVLPVIW